MFGDPEDTITLLDASETVLLDTLALKAEKAAALGLNFVSKSETGSYAVSAALVNALAAVNTAGAGLVSPVGPIGFQAESGAIVSLDAEAEGTGLVADLINKASALGVSAINISAEQVSLVAGFAGELTGADPLVPGTEGLILDIDGVTARTAEIGQVNVNGLIQAGIQFAAADSISFSPDVDSEGTIFLEQSLESLANLGVDTILANNKPEFVVVKAFSDSTHVTDDNLADLLQQLIDQFDANRFGEPSDDSASKAVFEKDDNVELNIGNFKLLGEGAITIDSALLDQIALIGVDTIINDDGDKLSVGPPT